MVPDDRDRAVRKLAFDDELTEQERAFLLVTFAAFGELVFERDPTDEVGAFDLVLEANHRQGQGVDLLAQRVDAIVDLKHVAPR